jgi:SAM-dependent methyltransferase
MKYLNEKLSMKELLRRNRQKVNEDLRSAEQRKFFSPTTYSAYQVTTPAILAYAHGKLIDIGCGDMPYKDLILDKVTQYDTLDIERRVAEVKFVCDIQNMDIISDNSYDSAVCLEVLEHVQNPFQAIAEVHRILKKGGMLILSVPHLSRLHEEPNDFFRYTKYGIQFLLEDAGFKVLKITERAGIFSFLGHQFSTVFVCLLWHIPIIKRIVFFVNKWLCVKPCYLLDKIFDKKKIFALGYTCVAQKR